MNTIVTSLLIHKYVHEALQTLTAHLANSLTCCLFQIYFVSKSFGHLYNEYYELEPFEQIQSSTRIILYQAMGYFIYDLLYLYKRQESQWKLYVAHHIAGLIMLIIMLNQGIQETWYHNLVCFTSEIINPPLNLRSAFAQWFGKPSMIYRLNKKLIVVNYTVFRIVIFPIVAYKIAPFIEDTWAFVIIYILTTGLYATSVMWYRKLLLNLQVQ